MYKSKVSAVPAKHHAMGHFSKQAVPADYSVGTGNGHRTRTHYKHIDMQRQQLTFFSNQTSLKQAMTLSHATKINHNHFLEHTQRGNRLPSLEACGIASVRTVKNKAAVYVSNQVPQGLADLCKETVTEIKEFNFAKEVTQQDVLEHLQKNPGIYLLYTDFLYKSDTSKRNGIQFYCTGHIMVYDTASSLLISRSQGSPIHELGEFSAINEVPDMPNKLSVFTAKYDENLTTLLDKYQNAETILTVMRVDETSKKNTARLATAKQAMIKNGTYILRSGMRTETFDDEALCLQSKQVIETLFCSYGVLAENYHISAIKTRSGQWSLTIQVTANNCCVAAREALLGKDLIKYQLPIDEDRLSDYTPRQTAMMVYASLFTQYVFGNDYEDVKAQMSIAREEFQKKYGNSEGEASETKLAI